ncbi:hypothetical protein [Polyangium aurulentum]|uniref:hypothetical protein n=1 Tax=Polyangium aurulentum TaxID=2567896 RepID=UPI0010AE0AA6|nr:hypothetical protein [Polyangium aurulentum]UQA62534.1 hypothetical protein E8A73_019600 [Polyangium aurulentum]
MEEPQAQGFSIAEKLPPEVELRQIGLSFTLPEGKNLTRTLTRELRTESETVVSLRVSPEKLELCCSPAILIDAQWPAQNMLLGGASVRFADAQIEVTVAPVDGLAEGILDFTATAQKEISALITAGLEGTAAMTPGYNPFTDRALLATLDAISANFERQPSNGVSDVTTTDLGKVCVEATIALRKAFSHAAEGAGLELPEGASLHVRVAGAGDVAQIARAVGAAECVRAANIVAITLSCEALSVISGGKPVAQLKRIRVDRGGAVTIEQLRLQGSLEDAAGVESLVRVLAEAAKLAGHGVPLEAGVQVAANTADPRAQVVPGLARNQIEAALTEGVQGLVREHATALPGLDLREIFGAPDKAAVA